jgi:predicted lactoylglutathione lyase
MTNESDTDLAADHTQRDAITGRARFGMVVLFVRDLARSIAFYRLLGLEVSDPRPERPVAAYVEGGATRLIITTDPVARRFDRTWVRPERGGYQQVVEFFLDDDAAVDAAWERLTSAGHPGISPPQRFVGPYGTMVEDPDGNVVLLTNDPAEDARASAPAR